MKVNDERALFEAFWYEEFTSATPQDPSWDEAKRCGWIVWQAARKLASARPVATITTYDQKQFPHVDVVQWARRPSPGCHKVYAASQSKPVVPHPLDALLPEVCQLIDAVKVEWKQQGCWSDWDESVRERISAYHIGKLSAPRAENPVLFAQAIDRAL